MEPQLDGVEVTAAPVLNASHKGRELVDAVEARGFTFGQTKDAPRGWMVHIPESAHLDPNKDPLMAELGKHSSEVGDYLRARDEYVGGLVILPAPEVKH